ncbi:predicted protein [Postia placenta Mad-698-R]|nr:predicted protein [Postia placenta Mad-698-R]
MPVRDNRVRFDRCSRRAVLRFGGALGERFGGALSERFGSALGERFGGALSERFGFGGSAVLSASGGWFSSDGGGNILRRSGGQQSVDSDGMRAGSGDAASGGLQAAPRALLGSKPPSGLTRLCWNNGANGAGRASVQIPQVEFCEMIYNLAHCQKYTVICSLLAYIVLEQACAPPCFVYSPGYLPHFCQLVFKSRDVYAKDSRKLGDVGGLRGLRVHLVMVDVTQSVVMPCGQVTGENQTKDAGGVRLGLTKVMGSRGQLIYRGGLGEAVRTGTSFQVIYWIICIQRILREDGE